MNGNITVTGMVISSRPIGETDKRVTLLTVENGKISAFAKGAKKPTSSLLAATNPFVFGEFELYVGRSSMTIVRANIKNYFNEIQNSIESVYFGSYFLELADFFAKENNDDRDVLKLLYQTIRALCKGSIPNRLIRLIYEFKMLVINGEYPNCFECSVCGSKENLTGFSFINNGCVCSECAGSVRDHMPLDTSAVYTLQYITGSSIEKLYTFTVTDKIYEELRLVIGCYLRMSVDVTLNSEAFLKEL
ncbi:MAG: DNA repair protein RecO [Lachnospiraceae bacterium]|nr:DNA repair protein RecO [Lachnospiraceae bacterium]